MLIQTEQTPNPSTLKFLPGEEVMGNRGTANFLRKDQHINSPLVRKIFEIEDISGVLLGYDFITVTKHITQDWKILTKQIFIKIMEHYTSGDCILDLEIKNKSLFQDQDDNNPLIRKIKQLLDTRIRPAVAQDGGDIIFHHFTDGIVYLEMHGACSGCPSSTATLKVGIENMLRYYIPEVQEVRAIT